MKRSALSLIGSLVGLVYLAYLCFELWFAQNPYFLTIEAAGFSMRVAALLPTAVLTGAAVLLSLIGFAARKRVPVLIAAILYLISLPLVWGMYAIPLALSLILLADFFASLIRGRKNRPAKAPEADEAAPGKADEADDPLEIEPPFDDDVMDDADDAADDDLNDNFDEPADDTGDDLRLETMLEDVTDDTEEENRQRSDGMAVFLGIFMGLVALALLGMIVYGVMGGKLPFMP